MHQTPQQTCNATAQTGTSEPAGLGAGDGPGRVAAGHTEGTESCRFWIWPNPSLCVRNLTLIGSSNEAINKSERGGEAFPGAEVEGQVVHQPNSIHSQRNLAASQASPLPDGPVRVSNILFPQLLGFQAQALGGAAGGKSRLRGWVGWRPGRQLRPEQQPSLRSRGSWAGTLCTRTDTPGGSPSQRARGVPRRTRRLVLFVRAKCTVTAASPSRLPSQAALPPAPRAAGPAFK